MATGNMHGDVALWDLSTRRLAHIMKGAHQGYITSLTFLNNQPVLVTGATDNSVKVINKICLVYTVISNPSLVIAMDL
jgi:U3 small nucleolar RNA-associated protein 21